MKHFKVIFLITTILSFSIVYGQSKSDNQILGQGGTGIIINDIRNFSTNQATVYKEDGEIISQTRGQGGTGFKTRYRIGSDVTPDITGGTITEIDLINTHKGPVTSLDPFKIFNVDALITSDTFFDDNLTFEDIVLGEELKVSGFVDSNSTLIVSRIERDDDPLTEWKISGYVSALTATQFNLQNQVVEIGAVMPDDCAMGFADGEFVEVKANPDALFTTGSPLTTVTDIDCVPEGIVTLPGDVIPVALEGIIDFEDIELNNLFAIAGQQINVDGSTAYINGEIDDIVVGAKVEVEGLMNTTTSIIDALKVKFKEVRFKFEEPVLPSDVITGESISIYGQTVFTTPQLRDEDGIIGFGLGSETQVEVRGYADTDGNLYATRVRERGNPDTNDVSADGSVTAINDPMIEIFGVVVDTTGSVFFDINGMPISSIDFFNSIAIGTEVEVEEATVNQMTNVITGGIIRIDEEEDSTRFYDKAGTNEGLGIGVITNKPDLIFTNSFE